LIVATLAIPAPAWADAVIYSTAPSPLPPQQSEPGLWSHIHIRIRRPDSVWRQQPGPDQRQRGDVELGLHRLQHSAYAQLV